MNRRHSFALLVAIASSATASPRYAPDDAYRLFDSLEKFRGGSGATVAAYKGDDGHSTWEVGNKANVYVVTDADDAYEGRNYLRIGPPPAMRSTLDKQNIP